MTPDTVSAGPLAGIRILDLSSVVMGPFATMILADMGADVIKVEAPAGDTTRRITPRRHDDMGYMFLHLNRNKRSVVLDLKRPEGLDALLRLARTADAVVTNVRPNALRRLGLDHGRLSRENPGIVLLSFVGFDEDGPYAARPVYEDLIQGLTALPTMLVAAGSEQPHYVPIAFNDRAVGLHGAIALLAALRHRDRTGRGQELRIPMFETMAQWVLGEHLGGETFDPPMGGMGYRRTLDAQRRPYRTADGHVCVIVYTDNHWRAFLRLIGRAELFDTDPRLRDIGARTAHAAELYPLLSDAFSARTTAAWLADLAAADIPATPLHTLESLRTDPHLAAVSLVRDIDHPSEGRIRQVRPAGRWSETPPAIRRPAPRLGEHSRDLLREAGLDEAEVAGLLASGAAIQAEDAA